MTLASAVPKDEAQRTTRRFDPRRWRFALLLASLILLLLLSPVLEGEAAAGFLLSFLFTLVLIAAVLAASTRRATLGITLVFALPWLYLTWLHPQWRADAIDVIASLLLVCLGLFVVGLVLMRVLRAERVDADILCGALAVYLLTGVVWAVCYGIIEALAPGSFGLSGEASGDVWNQLLYFSLVTLTTLGYGDISPISSVARIWSALEAVVGTLYLAVLISRLVGLYRS